MTLLYAESMGSDTTHHPALFSVWIRVLMNYWIGCSLPFLTADPYLNQYFNFLWRSLLAYGCIKLPYPQLSQVSFPKTSHVSLQPSSTHSWLKPHPLLNELAILKALGWLPLIQTGIKLSLSEMGAPQGERTFSQPVFCKGREKWAI